MSRLEFNSFPLSDAEVRARCLDPHREILGGTPWGNRIVKLSESVVVKYGMGASEEEAKNLKIAHDLLNPGIVRVPLVYRFFAHENLGFIVMERIHGRILGPSEYPALAVKTAQVLTEFSRITSQRLGPFGGGLSQGLIWEQGTASYNSIKQMEDWFAERLLQDDTRIELEEHQLVFCHLDVAPRNILWLEDDTLCFVDWASAGFYPRVFEFLVLHILAGKDGNFNQLLMEAMEPLNSKEETQLWLLMRAWGNTIRYHLCVPWLFPLKCSFQRCSVPSVQAYRNLAIYLSGKRKTSRPLKKVPHGSQMAEVRSSQTPPLPPSPPPAPLPQISDDFSLI